MRTKKQRMMLFTATTDPTILDSLRKQIGSIDVRKAKDCLNSQVSLTVPTMHPHTEPKRKRERESILDEGIFGQ